MIRQIIKVIRLLGLGRAVRMKRRHDRGLTYVRGYAACSCWWTLLNTGFLDELSSHGQLELEQYCRDHHCVGPVLEAMVEYLDGIGLLRRRCSMVRLSKAGRSLLAEPRGLFELLWAYEPCFSNLTALLTGNQQYGRDITRDVTYVGIGSGRLCEQLPYPIMRRMVLDHRCRMVLDLGCGDLAFLAGLCRIDHSVNALGIDCSPQMVQYNQRQLDRHDYNGRLTVQQADMFALDDLPDCFGTVDCITACDTFHEYLDDPQRLIGLLAELRRRFSGALFVVGEFCLQDADWLRRHPTASLEHHLFHQLSNQQIGTAAQWRDIFTRAGLTILEQQVFDLIGHGYFALR